MKKIFSKIMPSGVAGLVALLFAVGASAEAPLQSFGGITVDAGTYGGAYGERNPDVAGGVKTKSSGFSDVKVGGHMQGDLCSVPDCTSVGGGLKASFGQMSQMQGQSVSGQSEKPAFIEGGTFAGGGITANLGDGKKSGIGAKAGTAGYAGAEGRGGQVLSYGNTFGVSKVAGGMEANSLCPDCPDGSKGAHGMARQHSKAGSMSTAGSSGISWTDVGTGASASLNFNQGGSAD